MDERPEEQMRRQGNNSPQANPAPEDSRRLSADRGELGPDPANANDELEQTRLELARTRAQMSETIEVLQGRMNAQYIKEQTRRQVSSSVRGSGSSVVDGVKRNPLPLALVGTGLGWLLVNAGTSKESRGDYESGQRELEGGAYGGSYAREHSYGYRPGDEYRASAERGAPRRAGSSADASRGSDRDTEYREGSSRGEQAQQAGQQAQERAEQGARKAKGGFQKALQESPLALGAAAVGLGVAIGLSIPESEKENQMMGETRDRLKDQAEHKAQDAKERAQRVAEEAKETAKEEASNQDLKS